MWKGKGKKKKGERNGRKGKDCMKKKTIQGKNKENREN